MYIIKEATFETVYRLTQDGWYPIETKVEKRSNGKYYTINSSFPNVKKGVELEIDKKATKKHEVDVYKVKK